MKDDRQAAIAFMQRMLAFGEDQEHYRAAINALRRSQTHSAIQSKCNEFAARLAKAEAELKAWQGDAQTYHKRTWGAEARLADAEAVLRKIADHAVESPSQAAYWARAFLASDSASAVEGE